MDLAESLVCDTNDADMSEEEVYLTPEIQDKFIDDLEVVAKKIEDFIQNNPGRVDQQIIPLKGFPQGFAVAQILSIVSQNAIAEVSRDGWRETGYTFLFYPLILICKEDHFNDLYNSFHTDDEKLGFFTDEGKGIVYINLDYLRKDVSSLRLSLAMIGNEIEMFVKKKNVEFFNRLITKEQFIQIRWSAEYPLIGCSV